jgi:hypothetical protein
LSSMTVTEKAWYVGSAGLHPTSGKASNSTIKAIRHKIAFRGTVTSYQSCAGVSIVGGWNGPAN